MDCVSCVSFFNPPAEYGNRNGAHYRPIARLNSFAPLAESSLDTEPDCVIESAISRIDPAMISPFHIFKMQSDGSRRYIEGAVSVERGKARVQVLAASSPGEYVITDLTGHEISIKWHPRRIMFQIGYDERELNARAELFRRMGHEVISVPDNEAAKLALSSACNVDVFVVGYTAPEQMRKEMVDWLKANFPMVKIVALIPSANRQLPRADYNVVLNDCDEWMSLLAATAS